MVEKIILQEFCHSDFSISKNSIKSGELLRIQFNNLSNYNDFLRKNDYSNVINVMNWGKKQIKKNLFQVYSSRELLINHLNYNEDDLKEFEYKLNPQLRLNYKKSIFLNDKITNLPEPYQNIIFLKIISEKYSRPILIGTAGMHIDNLKLCYFLLSSFLEKGGICIESTYPILSKNEFIDILGVEPKVITII